LTAKKVKQIPRFPKGRRGIAVINIKGREKRFSIDFFLHVWYDRGQENRKGEKG
jgi:hypothetical protein